MSDTPLIPSWTSTESQALVSELKNNSHIKKAIFVYNTNKEFIRKFDGVTHVQKELNIGHDIVKKYALINKPYKEYIFSYERLD